MTQVRLRARGFDAVQRRLAQKERRSQRVIRRIAPDIIDHLRTTIRGYFINEAGPDGPWPALAPRTIAEKGHDRILFLTGRLSAALTARTMHSIIEVHNQHLTFGVDGVQLYYSRRHEKGLGVPRRGYMPYGHMVSDYVADQALRTVLGPTASPLRV